MPWWLCRKKRNDHIRPNRHCWVEFWTSSSEQLWICFATSPGSKQGDSSLGLNSRGVEGHCLRLVEEEEPFCLGGKVHSRTSWVEQALHREGLLRRTQKAWAYGTSDHLSFHLRKLMRFWRMLKSNVLTSGQWSWLSNWYWGQICEQSCFKRLALSSVSESGLRFLRTQVRGESFGTDWPDPIIERQAEAPIESSSSHP